LSFVCVFFSFVGSSFFVFKVAAVLVEVEEEEEVEEVGACI